jgi:hypothetical protein
VALAGRRHGRWPRRSHLIGERREVRMKKREIPGVEHAPACLDDCSSYRFSGLHTAVGLAPKRNKDGACPLTMSTTSSLNCKRYRGCVGLRVVLLCLSRGARQAGHRFCVWARNSGVSVCIHP